MLRTPLPLKQRLNQSPYSAGSNFLVGAMADLWRSGKTHRRVRSRLPFTKRVIPQVVTKSIYQATLARCLTANFARACTHSYRGAT
ncbi:hypothetical protein NPIL_120871 [Nephila pilipes]|uniref:Uncharacterized protein n=1 Tax=Nephila pilipes TaxID=299642 RepID=A0A8X6PUH2_NEPPI|nr:hypothetical protein NPIL_120871 [Nephila pilipes]